MNKGLTLILCATILLFSVYSNTYLPSAKAQIANWKKYTAPGQKFNLLHPPNRGVKGKHDNITGTTEVILENHNSTKAQVSILYNPYDALLKSKTGKIIVLSRAVTNLENEISVDYVFFNSTGKFPHKYSFQNHQSASDIVG